MKTILSGNKDANALVEKTYVFNVEPSVNEEAAAELTQITIDALLNGKTHCNTIIKWDEGQYIAGESFVIIHPSDDSVREGYSFGLTILYGSYDTNNSFDVWVKDTESPILITTTDFEYELKGVDKLIEFRNELYK